MQVKATTLPRRERRHSVRLPSDSFPTSSSHLACTAVPDDGQPGTSSGPFVPQSCPAISRMHNRAVRTCDRSDPDDWGLTPTARPSLADRASMRYTRIPHVSPIHSDDVSRDDRARGPPQRPDRHGQRRPGHLRRHRRQADRPARSAGCTTTASSPGSPARPPIRSRSSRASRPSSSSTAATSSDRPSSSRRTGGPIASCAGSRPCSSSWTRKHDVPALGQRRSDRARRRDRRDWIGRRLRAGGGEGARAAHDARRARRSRNRRCRSPRRSASTPTTRITIEVL